MIVVYVPGLGEPAGGESEMERERVNGGHLLIYTSTIEVRLYKEKVSRIFL
jgi:hypothetical protein